eukprot:m.103978 g.103978  ORF g.103978 m.103978 type:complete len:418 (+) comp13248_c0_seq9:455-1708(+)
MSASATAMDTADERLQRLQRKIEKAKLAGRSELTLEGWQRYRYAKARHLCDDLPPINDNIERIDYNTVSKEEFIERFETPTRPVIIQNCVSQWPAAERWTMENLVLTYGSDRFKCGEDDDGNNVKLKLKHYHHYMQNNNDDSPMYIFDSALEKDDKRGLRHDYRVPKYFRDDPMEYCPDSRRPPHKWLVIGPKRSGTGIHIDPLATNAWNAIISGRKRWVVFPPSVPKEALEPKRGECDHEAASWFDKVYPRVTGSEWPHAKHIEFIQEAGEIVFMPGGWHHVVINITDSIAVTQNFCTVTTFPVIWRRTVHGRPKLSQRWLRELRTHRPELAAIADSVDLDADDGLPPSSSSDSSSSSSSSSSSEQQEAASPKPKRKLRTKKRSKHKKELCMCEECLAQCEICAAYLRRGETPPDH